METVIRCESRTDNCDDLNLHAMVIDGSRINSRIFNILRQVCEEYTGVKLVLVVPDDIDTSRQISADLLRHLRVVRRSSAIREIPALLYELVPDDLSERERDVMRRIALGFTNKEIAAQLELSVKSVEKYKTRFNKKLRLRSRAELVQYAIARGWMTDEPPPAQ